MHVHAFNVLKTRFLHTISVRTKSVSHLQNEKCLSPAISSLSPAISSVTC